MRLSANKVPDQPIRFQISWERGSVSVAGEGAGDSAGEATVGGDGTLAGLAGASVGAGEGAGASTGATAAVSPAPAARAEAMRSKVARIWLICPMVMNAS